MNHMKKLKVLLIEPHKYPVAVEIAHTLETMQTLVGGPIEHMMPFNDEVALVCNEYGKFHRKPLNRAIYGEPDTVYMTYEEMASLFRQNESEGKEPLTGYIVFTSDSFEKEYSERERTYEVSSRNKAYMPNMSGYSIFGSSLDGGDKNVRLERYMWDEKAGEDGWKIDHCYIKKDSKEIVDVIAGTFFLCYAPSGSEDYQSLPDEQMEKYRMKFFYPEFFYWNEGKMTSVMYQPLKEIS